MNRNAVIIAIVALFVLLLAALMLTIGLLIGGRDGRGEDARYELALQLYMDGDYERAAGIIDEILLREPRNRRALLLDERITEQLAQIEGDAESAPTDNAGTTASSRDAASNNQASASSVDIVSDSDAVLSTQTSNADAAQATADAERAAAEARLNAAARRDAERARQIEQLLTDGSALLAENRTEAARQQFQQILNITLDNAEQSDQYDSIALARIADAYRLDGKNDAQNYTLAQNRIAEARVLDADNWESYYIEGLIAIDQDRFSDAITALTTADRLQGDNADLLFALANAQYRSRLFDAAIGTYRRVLDLVQNYANAHYNLGLALLRTGNTPVARQTFQEGVSYYPNDSRLNYRLGIISIDLGRTSDAERYLRIAVQQSPQNAIYHGQLGNLYFNLYNINAAYASYRQAAQLAPDNVNLQYNLALTANILQDYDVAKRAIDIALRGNPNAASYHYTHGQILDSLDQDQEALAAFRQAINLDRDYAEAMSELGRLHIKTGNNTVGLSFLERAYTLKPSSPDVNNNIGRAYLITEDYNQAITHFTNAVNLRPNNNLFQYNLALPYIELKQYSKALEQLQVVLDADDTYWDAYFKIGIVHIARGDRDLARTILTQLARKNPNYYDIDEVNKILNNI